MLRSASRLWRLTRVGAAALATWFLASAGTRLVAFGGEVLALVLALMLFVVGFLLGSWRGAIFILASGALAFATQYTGYTIGHPYAMGLLASIVSGAVAIVVIPLCADKRATAVIAAAGVADARGLSAGGHAMVGVAGLLCSLGLLHLLHWKADPSWMTILILSPIVILAFCKGLACEVVDIVECGSDTTIGMLYVPLTLALVAVPFVRPAEINTKDFVAVAIVLVKVMFTLGVVWAWILAALLPAAAGTLRLKKQAEERAAYEKRHRAPLEEILKGVIR